MGLGVGVLMWVFAGVVLLGCFVGVVMVLACVFG
jgi:hypothetical protein